MTVITSSTALSQEFTIYDFYGILIFMNERIPLENKRAPENWSDIIGVVALKEDFNEDLQADKGLITLTTSDNLEVCPMFQFDKTESEMTINPYIADAWSLFQSLQVSQLKESSWTKVGVLAQSRPEFEGKSWADVLRSPETDDSVRFQIYAAIVGDAVYAAKWLGKKLEDPRYTLPS